MEAELRHNRNRETGHQKHLRISARISPAPKKMAPEIAPVNAPKAMLPPVTAERPAPRIAPPTIAVAISELRMSSPRRTRAAIISSMMKKFPLGSV